MELPAEKEYYTFADILAWDENENAEIIDGEVYMMSAPLRFHQDISGRFYIRLGNYLEGKKCRVYSAPFSVRLFEKEGDRPEDVDTIVEPDISVICDPNKLDKYGTIVLSSSCSTSGRASANTGSLTRRKKACRFSC